MKNLLFILFLLPVCAMAQTTISTNQIRDAAITYVKIQQIPGLTMFGRSTNSTGTGENITAALDGYVLRRSGTTLAFGALDLSSANATTGTLSFAKLSSGTLASALTINGGNTLLTYTNFSGFTVESTAMHLNVASDINIDADGDVKINNVSGSSGEFIGNVDGHLVWAVPAGTGGGGSSSGVLDVQTTTVGNITTGEDVLYTYTLPADTLDVNEEGLNLRFSGRFAENGNTKTLKIKFGPTTIMTRALTTPTITTSWTVVCEIIRTSATTQECNCTFSGGDGLATSNIATASATLSSNVDIVVTGEATSTDDIERSTGTVTMLGGIGGGGGGDLSLSDLVASETPSGAVNGVNVTYTLGNTPAAFIHVYLDGLLQEEGGGNDYTISGATITMVSAPLTGSKVRVSYVK